MLFRHIGMVSAILATVLLLASPALAIEDVLLRVLMSETSAHNRAEERKRLDEELKKLPPTKQEEVRTEYERIRREYTFSMYGGVQNMDPLTSPNVNFRSGEFFEFHEDQPIRLFYMIKIPWIFHSVGLNYYKMRGDADYRYAESNVAYSGRFPFYMQRANLAYGIRIKPLHGRSAFQPFAEAGIDFGWTGFTFSDDARFALQSQGRNFRLHEDLLNFGYYFKGGLEWDIVPAFGVNLSYQLTKTSTSISRTVGSDMKLRSDSFLFGVHWRF